MTGTMAKTADRGKSAARFVAGAIVGGLVYDAAKAAAGRATTKRQRRRVRRFSFR